MRTSEKLRRNTHCRGAESTAGGNQAPGGRQESQCWKCRQLLSTRAAHRCGLRFQDEGLDELGNAAQPRGDPQPLLRRCEVIQIVQLGSQTLNELLEGSTFTLKAGVPGKTATTGRRKGRGVLHDAVAPDLVQVLANVELPIDSGEEGKFIFVDLADLEPRNLAPGSSRIIAVLEPLRGEDQGSKEHTTATLQDPTSVRLVGLLHGEIMARNVRLDQD